MTTASPDLLADENLPTSNPDSPSFDNSGSDSDSYNTASARVYFGPLHSPEKRYISAPSRRRTLEPGGMNPPARRSARLSLNVITSSPLKPSGDNDGESEDEALSGADRGQMSRSATPENELYQDDEPSSALADRIIRAHDNPSPPPSVQERINATTDLDEQAFPLVDTTDSPTPTARSSTRVDNNGLAQKLFPLGSPRPTVTLDSYITPPFPKESPGDLISFDSFSTPSDPSHPAISLTNSILDSVDAIEPHSRVPLNTTVDDLFPPLTPSLIEETTEPLQLSTPSSSSSIAAIAVELVAEEGNEQADDGIISASGPTVFQPPAIVPTQERSISNLADVRRETLLGECYNQTNNDRLAKASANVSEATAVLSQEESRAEPGNQSTPLRRSSRPRTSATPHSAMPTPSVGSPSKRSYSTGAESSLRRKSSPRTSPRRSQNNVGTWKRRALSPFKGTFRVGGEHLTTTSNLFESEITANYTAFSVDSVGLEMQGESPKKRGKRREEPKQERTADDLQRLMGSLSPGSAGLLTQLVASATTSSGAAETTTAEGTAASAWPSSLQHPIADDPDSAVSASAMHVDDSSHATATALVQATPSPAKREPIALNDPHQTPARRIPIEEAVAKGHISPQKAAQLQGWPLVNGFGSPRVHTLRLMDSPARRVPVSAARPSPLKSLAPRFASPLKAPFSEQRGTSQELKSNDSDARDTKSRTGDATQHHASTTPNSKSNRNLPFPLTPSESLKPESSHEEKRPHSGVTGRVEEKGVGYTSSSAKSSLRIPSAGSRIPRIGVKPYARPSSTVVKTASSAAKRPITRTADFKPIIPDSSKDTSSTCPNAGNNNSNTLNSISSAAPNKSALIKGKLSGSSSPLKRKREGESLLSSEKGRSVVMIRQVLPDNSKALPKPGTAANLSPKKKTQGPFIFRKVVDRDPTPHQGNTVPPSEPSKEGSEGQGTGGTEVATLDEALSDPPPSSESSDGVEHSPPPSSPIAETVSTLIRGHGAEHRAKAAALRSPSPTDNQTDSGVRRTRRLRKPAMPLPGNDVFGSFDARPSQPRRRRPPAARGDLEGYSALSATALKALTTSNTSKNQKYLVANLETTIVRKEGIRPESPTIKVKTISQKQQEEKGKQRSDRAQRRARRSEDGSSDIDGPNDGDSSLIDDDQYELGDHPDFELKPPRKHRRGPGDEEDYETPNRPDDFARRLKFGAEDEQLGKRVKWDHGLSTTIYLDQIHPRAGPRSKEESIKRGCLAKTAKTLRLDNLGNIAAANAPLNLINENVVVKKFIYDNDLEPPAPDVIIPKNTRSKSKKAKS